MTNQDRKTAIRKLMADQNLSYAAASRLYADGRHTTEVTAHGGGCVSTLTGKIYPHAVLCAAPPPPLHCDGGPGSHSIRVIYDVFITPESEHDQIVGANTRVVLALGTDSDELWEWGQQAGLDNWGMGDVELPDGTTIYRLTGHELV